LSNEIGLQESKRDNLFLKSIPLVMAFSCIGGMSFGGVRHTGLFWMASIVFGFILIPLKGSRKITFPWLGWLPFFVFCGFSLGWSDLDWRNNIQMFIQMLCFPVIGTIASYSIRSEADLARYNNLYIFATLFIGVMCVYYMLGPGRSIQKQIEGVYSGFSERPAACSLIIIAAIFLAQIHKIPKTAIFMWLLTFVICIISESRMATLVLLLLWMIHPQLASIQLRLVLIAAVLLLGLAAFNTSIIQDRFFKKSSGFSGSGSIEDVMKGKFDSAGRFDAWPIVLERSGDTPWFGHGIGQSAPFVYSVWAPMDKPHNEYLKVLYDGGYIGLGCFVLGLLSTLGNLTWNLYRTGMQNWATSAAIMGWVGFILMAVVDNPLVYGNNFTHPLFFLVGATNGITSAILLSEKNMDSRDILSMDSDVRKSSRSRQVIMLR